MTRDPVRRRANRWRAFAIAALGLVAGAGATSAIDLAQSSPASVVIEAPTTLPSRAPSATTPITPTTPSTAPLPESVTRDLTIGLVNIETVNGFEGSKSVGTGFVLRSDGEVLTNNHVIEGSTSIQVTVVATGKTYKASVVGAAPSKDVALLKLRDASGLAVAPLGDSSNVEVGDAVVGIGNAGGTGTPTTSPGYVVSLGETITATDQSGGDAETLHNLIQISAQLFPGQSGGPLYDASGKVVGVDSAGSTGHGVRTRNSGAAFAIPINDALAIVKKIRSGVVSEGITIGTPPLLGIAASDASGAGARVSSVTARTPAATAGLQPGDVIVAFDREAIVSVDNLTAAIRARKAGDDVTVTFTRAGTSRSATVTLIAGPAD